MGGWLYVLEGHMGGRQPVILLDTDLTENDPADRELTHYLYGGDETYRLKQEIVLGIGGVRMLHALGFRVRQYHLNEGHAALLCLELLNQFAYADDDLRPGDILMTSRVRELCNFTTHTPVEAGQDKFSYDVVQRILGDFVDLAMLRRLAGDDQLNMTRLALNCSDYVNGVAKRHAETSRHLFPGYRVRSVTNGVHPFTWTHAAFARLYDGHLPGWCHEPELLIRAECCISDDAIWQAHRQAKQALVERVKSLTGTGLDAEVFTVGFARRMTAYKRPELIFSDMARLRKSPERCRCRSCWRARRTRAIRMANAPSRRFMRISVIYPIPCPPCSCPTMTAIAAAMVAGVDVWLNTPLPPWEASGT